MNRSAFIITNDSYSGKSLITLGIMQMVMKKTSNVAFFRPIIDDNYQKIKDNHIKTVISHFNLKMEYEDAYAFTRKDAVNLYNNGKVNEFFSTLICKYKNLEKKFDFILVEGTNFFNEINPFDFDVNNFIAKDLNLPIILVVNGYKKNINDLYNNILVQCEAIYDKGNKIIMIVINKTYYSQNKLESFFKSMGFRNGIIFLSIPLEYFLSKPTLIELKNNLNANLILGKKNDLNKIVVNFIVGAMQINNYLNRLIDGSLVITAGDRYDLIFSTILANIAFTYPRIVGIILTGGIIPENNIFKLIKGIPYSIPILSVQIGTFETASIIASIKPKIYSKNFFKIKKSIDLFESCANLDLLDKKITCFKSSSITPMMFQYNITQKSQLLQKHIVLPEGFEERILRAASMFIYDRLGKITLLGNLERIKSVINNLGIYWNKKFVNIIDPVTSCQYKDFYETFYKLRKDKGIQLNQAKDLMLDSSYFGTMMVYKGIADGMVSGAVHTTSHTIRPALQFIKTKPSVDIISSVFFMLLSDRVLVYGDCAIVPNPTAEQLASIAILSANTAKNFGIDPPRVAILSYSSGDSGSGEDVEKVKIATSIVKKKAPDLLIEGPIQYDAAVDINIAKQKLPNSLVAGKANVLIFPDLNTGNNTYKAVQRETKALAIGPILQGLNKPVNDLSRGATVKDIYNTILITTIQSSFL